MNPERLGRLLAQARSGGEKTLWLGALLAKEAGTPIVIVGGSAVEIYTSGRYVSGDVDLVGERAAIISALEGWGFRREGRLWSRSELSLWVDPVGAHYTGEVRRLREVSTPHGPVRLASVEDLIAKRLIEVKVWHQAGTELFDQALALAAEYVEEIDWEYVTLVARRDRADDLVPELRRRIARERSRIPPTGSANRRTVQSGVRGGRGPGPERIRRPQRRVLPNRRAGGHRGRRNERTA